MGGTARDLVLKESPREGIVELVKLGLPGVRWPTGVVPFVLALSGGLLRVDLCYHPPWLERLRLRCEWLLALALGAAEEALSVQPQGLERLRHQDLLAVRLQEPVDTVVVPVDLVQHRLVQRPRLRDSHDPQLLNDRRQVALAPVRPRAVEEPLHGRVPAPVAVADVARVVAGQLRGVPAADPLHPHPPVGRQRHEPRGHPVVLRRRVRLEQAAAHGLVEPPVHGLHVLGPLGGRRGGHLRGGGRGGRARPAEVRMGTPFAPKQKS
mmetsp:Transcript_104805/g.306055  ORF Transcript_104805/g.306055 Transcript_104805/m.306055 type:complete len:266 (+) Transcript_104805:692-1489(+)